MNDKIGDLRISINFPSGSKCEVDNNNVTIICKQPIRYPKDVVECREVINNTKTKKHAQYVVAVSGMFDVFETLMMCRGAYWSIANDWRPFWKDPFQERYSIVCDLRGNLQKVHNVNRPTTFVFPTGEMRDAFFENFECLLNQCRELVI